MSNEKIGLFDSGVGCLSILVELIKELPNESFCVFGDSINNPYGVREDKEITRLSVEAFKKVEGLGIKACVVGSNTSTIYALEDIKKSTDIPVIGVIEPGINAAIKSGCENILIMGTPATIKSEFIKNKLLKTNPILNIEGIATPIMEDLAEEGKAKTNKAKDVVYKYLDSVKIIPDCVMLSCTHFPIFEDIIKDYYKEKGKDVIIINPAKSTALDLRRVLEDHNLLSDEDNTQKIEFYTSGDKEIYKNTGNLFLDGKYIIEEVKNI